MASYEMNPQGEIRDPDQMIREMKKAEREREQEDIESMIGGRPEENIEFKPSTPQVIPTGDEDIEIKPRDLASGIYKGAGGYKYEVMPGGEIKILDAPAGRGVGVTLKFGHPAHEAIFEELSSGAKPMEGETRAEESKTLSEMIKEDKEESTVAVK
tara:strand:+ start:50 stop:517 length:468 start_codon:yes stop_codon:yes gene_type:complete